MKRVYLSGPITRGNRSWNFYQACEAQRLLLDAGYAVLNPMLSMAHPDGSNIPWESWIVSDLEFVKVCNIVIRLPGHSRGADIETQFAHNRGISVVFISGFDPLGNLVDWIAKNKEPEVLDPCRLT